MRFRRLLVLAALTIAPTIAACGAGPTSPDDPTPPPAPTDTTGRKETWPWG